MDRFIVNQEAPTPRLFSDLESDALSFGEPTSESGLDQEMILEQVLSDQTVTQHWTRRCDDASDTINAYFRCWFSVNQQRFILHVPFVPSFLEIPEVVCNMIDDCAGRIRVTDQQKFGVRLELILERPVTEPTTVLIEVSATASRRTH